MRSANPTPQPRTPNLVISTGAAQPRSGEIRFSSHAPKSAPIAREPQISISETHAKRAPAAEIPRKLG
jgi:hypothetical protein